MTMADARDARDDHHGAGAGAASVPLPVGGVPPTPPDGTEAVVASFGAPVLLTHESETYLHVPPVTLREGDFTRSSLSPFVVLVDVSGSMKHVPKHVLAASLYRLLAFVATQARPVAILTYNDQLHFVDTTARALVSVAQCKYRPSAPMWERLHMATSCPVERLEPRIIAHDPDLLKWVVDTICSRITGYGYTFSVCAVNLAGRILNTHSDSGGSIICVCDGMEYYGMHHELTGEHMKAVMSEYIERIPTGVTVSYLALGMSAAVHWMGVMAKVFGGVVSFVQNPEDLPLGLEEIVSHACLQPQLVSTMGWKTARRLRSAPHDAPFRREVIGRAALAAAGPTSGAASGTSGQPLPVITQVIGNYPAGLTEVVVQDPEFVPSVTFSTSDALLNTTPMTLPPPRPATVDEVAFILCIEEARVLGSALKAVIAPAEGVVAAFDEAEVLAVADRVQASIDALNERLDDKAVGLGRIRSAVLKPLRDLRDVVSLCLTQQAQPPADPIWRVLYVRCWRCANVASMSTLSIPSDLADQVRVLRFDEEVEAARKSHMEAFTAWALDPDHPERERYVCQITFEPEAPLCVPLTVNLRSKRELAALQYAMTWRDGEVPAGVFATMDSTALVGLDSFEAMMRGGARGLSDRSSIAVSAAGEVTIRGMAVTNPLLADRARKLQLEGVRVGWLQATDVVPLLVTRADATNRYMVKAVRQSLAQLQTGDKQFWGRPHLPLQTYGNFLGSFIVSACYGSFVESDLLLLTDLFRTLLLFGIATDHAEDWAGMLRRMTASPKTLCRHNISNLGILGAVAACAGPDAANAVLRPLWFEFLRRSANRRSRTVAFYRGGSGPFAKERVEPRVSPSRMMFEVRGDIGRANRFVAVVEALARVGPELMDVAPASERVLSELGAVLNSKKTASWTPKAAAGGRLVEAVLPQAQSTSAPAGEEAALPPGGGVEESKSGVEESKGDDGDGDAAAPEETGDVDSDAEEPAAGAGAAEGGSGSTASTSSGNIQLYQLPECISVENVVGEVALVHVHMEERHYRKLSTMPTLTGEVVDHIAQWVAHSEKTLRKAIPTLVPRDEVDAVELGARILAAPSSSLETLSRLYARYLKPDARIKVLDALGSAVLADDAVAGDGRLFTSLSSGAASAASHSLFGTKPPPVLSKAARRRQAAKRAAREAKAAQEEAKEEPPAPAIAVGEGWELGAIMPANLTNDLGADFAKLDVVREARARLEAERQRKAAALREFYDAAAERVDGRAVAAVLRPVTAMEVGMQGTGKPELRVKGANEVGLARCLAEMYPAVVREAVEAIVANAGLTGLACEGVSIEDVKLLHNPTLALVLVRAMMRAGEIGLLNKYLTLLPKGGPPQE